MIFEISVDLTGKRPKGLPALRRLRRGRQHAPLLEDQFRAIRPENAENQRRREQDETQKSEISTMAQQHSCSEAKI